MPELSKIKDRDTGVEYDIKDAQARKEIAALKENENGNNSGGNADQSVGLSATASALLITILRNGVYTSDQSANIDALEAELTATKPEEPDTPDAPDIPDVPEADITQNGSVLTIVSGVTVTQSGSVLSIR